MNKEQVIKSIKKDIAKINNELTNVLTLIPRQLEDLQIKMTQAISGEIEEESFSHNFTYHPP